MTVKDFLRGHEIYYDEKTTDWKFSNNDASTLNDRPCIKCKKQAIDGVDLCLYGLHDCDFIKSACCGHGVQKGYIVLKDGRRFEEVDMLLEQIPITVTTKIPDEVYEKINNEIENLKDENIMLNICNKGAIDAKNRTENELKKFKPVTFKNVDGKEITLYYKDD